MQTKQGLSHLKKLILAKKGLLSLGLLTLAGGSSINLLLPQVIRYFLAPDKASALLDNPWPLATCLILLFALQCIFFYFRHYLFAILGQQLINDLRQKLYAAIISRELVFFDQNRPGDLVSRVSADSLMLQDAISVKFSVLVRYGFQVVAGIILMCLISFKLTLAIILALPLLVGVSMILGRKLKFYSKAQQTALGSLSSIAEEVFSQMRLVKAYSLEKSEELRFNQTSTGLLEIASKRIKISAFFSSFVSFLMNACIVLVVIFGVLLVGSQQLSLADLTAFMLYAIIVAVSFAFIAGSFSEFAQAIGAAERVFELIENQPQNRSGKLALRQPPQGALQFENVSFSFAARAEQPVLQNLSFSIPAGQSTALVGLSGAGKSTVVSLILGFYARSEGRILFDGLDIAELDITKLREQIAYVPQDAPLFGVSIADNLRQGKSSASLNQLQTICEQVGLADLLARLPEGLDTNVGRAGTQLSGGERQRLAIARALLRDPKLLILDEATSALDSRNETLVQESLSKLMQSRTVLIIAHRLATIQRAERVLVLDNGRIVQSGSHSALSQAEGLYRELVLKQKLA